MVRDRWTGQQIPDLRGRTVLVTGANSGLGRETAGALAGHGARVLLAVRDIALGRQAAERLGSPGAPVDVEVRPLDLADLESVKDMAGEVLRDHPRLDLLVNNAGVMMPPYGRTTDGFELQMGTNHLGHFALTGRLLPLLLETAGSRVVTITSLAHRSGRLDLEDLHWQRRRYRRWRSYSDSKLANLLFALELDRRLKAQGLSTLSLAAHPGWTATALQRHLGPLKLFNFLAMKADQGALSTLRAATEPGLVGGELFGPGGPGEVWGHPRIVRPSRRARDAGLARRLWERSEELTGVTYPLPT